MDVESIQISSFELHHVRIRPEEMIGVHSQASWEIVLVQVGRGTRTIGGQTDTFTEGDFLVIPPHVPHGWTFDPQVTDADGHVRDTALLINPTWLEQMGAALPELQPSIQRFLTHTTAFSFPAEERIQLTHFLEHNFQVDETLLALRVLEYVCHIARCTEIVPIEPAAPKRLSLEDKLAQTRIYILCNFMRKISLDHAARNVGMSRSLFCAFFKNATGTTFVNAINDCRINEACRLLANTSLSIAEIAERVGYSDNPYFNRQFKRRHHLSPLQWRQKHAHNV